MQMHLFEQNGSPVKDVMCLILVMKFDLCFNQGLIYYILILNSGTV